MLVLANLGTPHRVLHVKKACGAPTVGPYVRLKLKMFGHFVWWTFRNYIEPWTSNEKRELVEGDIVLIKDDNIPRNNWWKGKVEKLIIGKDGKTRGAKLTMVSKSGQRTSAARPVHKLVPLEIVNDTMHNDNSKIETKPSDETVTNTNDDITLVPNETRPRQKAALSGEETRRLKDIYF